MAEMTAVEYLKQKGRMTETCYIDCKDCNMYSWNNTKNVNCVELESEYPEEAISIVQKWAEEHPMKTMLQDFLEKYPYAMLDSSGIPKTCPYALGYTKEDECTYKDCVKCWNRPLER